MVKQKSVNIWNCSLLFALKNWLYMISIQLFHSHNSTMSGVDMDYLFFLPMQFIGHLGDWLLIVSANASYDRLLIKVSNNPCYYFWQKLLAAKPPNDSLSCYVLVPNKLCGLQQTKLHKQEKIKGSLSQPVILSFSFPVLVPVLVSPVSSSSPPRWEIVPFFKTFSKLSTVTDLSHFWTNLSEIIS